MYKTFLLLLGCATAFGTSFYYIASTDSDRNTTATIQILTVENEYTPFWHTVLQVTYPGFNRTYGFYSKLPRFQFWLWGWLSHPGTVISPDIYLFGSQKGTVPVGKIVGEPIELALNSTQTTVLLEAIREREMVTRYYSLFNRGNVHNCVSWVTSLINPILDGMRIECRVAEWMSLEIPSACHLIYN